MTDTASGDAQEEGRVKEGGLLFQWSGKTCLRESELRSEGKEDGVMHR